MVGPEIIKLWPDYRRFTQ